MNTFNPFQFLSAAFSQDKISEQQLKAQEFAQAINSETQKQFAKAPQRIQETLDVAQQNFISFQDTIQKTGSNFQNPQAVLTLWGEHLQSTYQRNVALFQKHHTENVNSLGELKGYFEKTGTQIKTDTEEQFKKFQEKTNEVIVDIQKNMENIQNEIKDNLETAQSQAVNTFNEAVKQTQSFNSAVQNQVAKGVSAISSAVENTTAAAQEVVKATSSTKKGKN